LLLVVDGCSNQIAKTDPVFGFTSKSMICALEVLSTEILVSAENGVPLVLTSCQNMLSNPFMFLVQKSKTRPYIPVLLSIAPGQMFKGGL
jgi:hypothetical protein